MIEQIYKIERVFHANRKDVWRALTEKDLMKQWYFDLPEFKAEIGFVFQFTGGEEGGVQYLHSCEITEVVPEQKLTHTWSYVGYGGISYLTFELFDAGADTLLKLTHSGIETFPANIKDFAFYNFENGWNHIIITSLKEFLENKKNDEF
jgi:uncharacterized protein YndB with AHSA1/START domain